MGQRFVPISDQLRVAITDSGLTPNAVAVKAGINAAQLYRFLSGERGLSLESLDKISRVIDLKISVQPIQQTG